MIESLAERLVGRYLVDDFIDSATGQVLVSKDKLITDADAQKIVASGATQVKIRSILACHARHGVCAKCYGANLANGKPRHHR